MCLFNYRLLYIAWLMQELIDTAIGTSNDFTLPQIALISIPGLGMWLLAAMLDYISIPKFNSKYFYSLYTVSQ